MHDTCSIYNPTVLLSAMSSAPAGQFIIITQTLRPPRQWKPYDPDRLPSETITERIILESARMWLGIPAGFQTVFSELVLIESYETQTAPQICPSPLLCPNLQSRTE
ncbi:hypothetical protein Pst134EB_022181 [Puccinia striiformis f. sp. tritici]|nr:hypothetical protein Pst134EB_022181 [Puccinia striiformis f. sp. tritici]